MSDSAARVSRYSVNPAERVRELLYVAEIPETAELMYAFSQGYERLDYRASEDSGSLHFESAACGLRTTLPGAS